VSLGRLRSSRSNLNPARNKATEDRLPRFLSTFKFRSFKLRSLVPTTSLSNEGPRVGLFDYLVAIPSDSGLLKCAFCVRCRSSAGVRVSGRASTSICVGLALADNDGEDARALSAERQEAKRIQKERDAAAAAAKEQARLPQRRSGNKN